MSNTSNLNSWIGSRKVSKPRLIDWSTAPGLSTICAKCLHKRPAHDDSGVGGWGSGRLCDGFEGIICWKYVP